MDRSRAGTREGCSSQAHRWQVEFHASADGQAVAVATLSHEGATSVRCTIFGLHPVRGCDGTVCALRVEDALRFDVLLASGADPQALLGSVDSLKRQVLALVRQSSRATTARRSRPARACPLPDRA